MHINRNRISSKHMIKLLYVILSVALICEAQDVSMYRFKNGSLEIGDFRSMNVDGTVQLILATDTPQIAFLGMEMSTLTPFILQAVKITDGPEFDYSFICRAGRWGTENPVMMTGIIKFKGKDENARIEGLCTDSNTKRWVFAANVTKSKTLFFPPKEAGRRAKNLIGQSVLRFSASELILYSIVDYPYIKGIDCNMLKQILVDASGPSPGAIIIGNDGKHCAIIDNEGDKFVHSNPNKKKVTLDPLSTTNVYFPKGFIYKGIPNRVIPDFLTKTFE